MVLDPHTYPTRQPRPATPLLMTSRDTTTHRPSAVLELPRQMWWCLICQKPWPCPTKQKEKTQ